MAITTTTTTTENFRRLHKIITQIIALLLHKTIMKYLVVLSNKIIFYIDYFFHLFHEPVRWTQKISHTSQK